MMILQAIILSNFKSYMGEIIIGPVQPFMTIVGPNGSGKSNIIDAISFVLGEALSVLRVKRLSELVYGYPTGKPMAGSTYVTLTFLIDNNQGKNFTRMIIGEDSQYKIDNEIVTSEFYMTTLQEYGLDIKSKHFLVTQGCIECIVMKKPKELSAMFEQISGSYMYKADYKRLKMKLAQMEDRILFAQNMKKQLLMNKKCAIIAKEEAEKYLNLQEQYKKEKLQYQLINLFLIKRTVETLKNEYRDIKSYKAECLRDKRNMMIVLEHNKLQFKSLTDSLEDIEQIILKLENVIQERKVQYTVFKESILHWQKKRDCARISLESANVARDTNKETIKELENELKQVARKLAEFKEVSEQNTIELSNSQVKRYFELKNTVECQAKDFMKKANSLIRDQEVDRDRLDNENRRRQELEDKVKQTALMKENLKTRLRKLQNAIAESTIVLAEKATKKQELSKKIIETNNKSLSLKDNIAKILEKLDEVDVDNDTISWQKKKAETIKLLKQLCPGVYDRLSNLCKPVHLRYKIAVIKVFGKFMDSIIVDTMETAMKCTEFLKLQKIGTETFLPLNSLKLKPLKEKLCNIEEPNVQLLYNVLNISNIFPQIDKAILFVTKSTLVCETPEDARRMAYEINSYSHDCVSLDGSFYRKDGTMSGGVTDLIKKAKQWEERDIIALKEQREHLKKELQDLPKVSLLQSELSVIDVQLKGLSLKNDIIEKDLKDTEDKIIRVNEESTEYDMELTLETISKIQRDMQARDKQLENVKRHISAIENSIFTDFCRNINVPNIDYYERNYLWTCQEQKKKQMKLENQHDLIQNQLRFEKDRNIEDKILNWIHMIEQADTKLIEMHQQEHSMKKAIEQEEEKLSKLRENCAIIKENFVNVENRVTRCKSQIDVISKLYLESRRASIIVQNKMQQQKIECDNILKECKMEDITIPMLSERLSDSKSSPSSSSSFTDSSIEWDMSKSKIDFLQFPRNISNSTEENLRDIAKQLNEKLTEIQNELEVIANPNLKVQENIDSTMQQIKEINEELKKLRKTTNKINKQFETIKIKRFNLFSECLDHVTAEIDSVYKSLVGHTSASAFLLSDNLEEPYEGGINYSCIAPSKRFQPLQNLSGGEKTLAGLALLFAFQRYKPTPFFIMDEGDAALDNINIKNVVRFIRSQADTTQFIIVSLHKLFYFYSDSLIGVTTEPIAEYLQSKVVAILLREYKEKLDK